VTTRERLPAAPLAAALLLTSVLGAGCASQRPYPGVGEAPPPPAAQQIDRAARLSREAQRLELAGDDDGAINKYREALTEYNEVPAAWNNLGRLLMKQGQNLQAAEAFKTASELSPTDPRPMHNLGALWESLGYYDDATRWYNEALKRDADYLPALRRFLLVQELRQTPDETTPERLKKALLMETDPWWINRFKRFHQRSEETRATTPTPVGQN
jgi:tetratricopeptide (TPR) repeat protein